MTVGKVKDFKFTSGSITKKFADGGMVDKSPLRAMAQAIGQGTPARGQVNPGKPMPPSMGGMRGEPMPPSKPRPPGMGGMPSKPMLSGMGGMPSKPMPSGMPSKPMQVFNRFNMKMGGAVSKTRKVGKC